MSMGSKCPSCGEYEGRNYCTFLPDPDNPDEWEWVTICMSCDHGIEGEDLLWYRDRLVATVKAFGLPGVTVSDGDGSIEADAVTFTLDPENPAVGVTMWSGSYPDQNDVDMGLLPSFDEAVRYVAWLLKMDEFQQTRYDRLLEQG